MTCLPGQLQPINKKKKKYTKKLTKNYKINYMKYDYKEKMHCCICVQIVYNVFKCLKSSKKWKKEVYKNPFHIM